jgi:hypothetical protein
MEQQRNQARQEQSESTKRFEQALAQLQKCRKG